MPVGRNGAFAKKRAVASDSDDDDSESSPIPPTMPGKVMPLAKPKALGEAAADEC